MRSFIFILLIAMLSAAMSACAAPPRPMANSVGVALDMLVERDDSVALYRVAADGTIAFAGGQDARLRRFSWTDTLRYDEVESIRANLQRPEWSEARRDTGRPEPGEQRLTLTVHQPFRGRFIIRGDEPEAVEELHGLLRAPAARRFDRELEALPKPQAQ